MAKRTRKSEIFLRSAGPLYLSPLTVCNSKVEIFVHLLRNTLLSAGSRSKKFFLTPQRSHSTIQI